MVRASQETSIGRSDEVSLVADSGGVIGVSMRRGAHGDQPGVLIRHMLEEELQPLAAALAGLLAEAEAYGRAAVDLWLVMARGAQVLPAQVASVHREMHVSRELTVPADDDEVQELAASWHRELQRNVGIVKYEGESEM